MLGSSLRIAILQRMVTPKTLNGSITPQIEQFRDRAFVHIAFSSSPPQELPQISPHLQQPKETVRLLRTSAP